MNRHITIGTRGSALARWQANHVRDLLAAAWPVLEIAVEVIQTQGDRVLDTPLPLIGGKGVFTAELETALRGGTIDLAVHSLKDLPTEDAPGLTMGAIPARGRADDALISRAGHTLTTLPPGASVGTGSRRRAAQLRHQRPDLQTLDIRGNVDTRIRKALDENGPYDAIVLAVAGLERLNLTQTITEYLSFDDMLPAPGQGALAVQCRADAQSLELLAPIDDAETRIAVSAERTFLAGLGGGCSLPIAAYATVQHPWLRLRGRVSATDGGEQIDVQIDGDATLNSAQRLGAALARQALDRGVGRLLESSE